MEKRIGCRLGWIGLALAVLLFAAGCGSGGGGGGTPAGTWYEDADGDGYTTGNIAVSVGQPEGYVAETAIVDPASVDCDDTSSAVNPAAAENCNGVDDDCDDAADEGVTSAFYADADADGSGDAATSVQACSAPVGYVADASDCDDTTASIHPGVAEICNGLDDDCDAATADGSGEAALGNGCDGPDSDLCAEGTLACVGGAMECSDTSSDDVELCDGLDNDCNGSTDEVFTLGANCSVGTGECARTGVTVCSGDGLSAECGAQPGTASAELCDGKDNDCDGTADDGFALGNTCSEGVGACAASGVTVCSGDGLSAVCDAVPGTASTELCGDGLDNDCDGTVDEGFTLGEVCSEGIGECAASGVTVCSPDRLSAVCDAVPGTPSAEVCDGKDNDCNGAADDSLAVPPASNQNGVCAGALQVCLGADGWRDDFSGIALYQPSETYCEGLDNDCDGAVDEGLVSTFYQDFDADGYGDPLTTIDFCFCPTGYADNRDDCDDTDPLVNPGGTEIAGNRVDEDCDGDVACDAYAGPNQTVSTSTIVILDGSGSFIDPDLTPAAFSWSVVSGPGSPTLAPIPNPTFTSANTAGTYLITLTVTDSGGYQDTASVTITTVSTNLPPVADAGPDQYVRVADTVSFDGSGSYDPDGGVADLTFAWIPVSWPSGGDPTLTGSDTMTPSFVAAVEGEYVFSLVVTDADLAASPADTVTVSATTEGNRAPVADAGRDIYKNTVGTVTLDGSGSYDPDGDPLTFGWTALSGGATLTAPDSSTPHFTPAATGSFSFSLVVCDNLGFCSDPDTVLVTIGDITNWLRATLTGADFSGMVLRGVNYNGATLIDCLFIGCDLSTGTTATNFRDAILSYSNFTGSNLSGANLNGADLYGVNFTNAILAGVTNMSSASNLDTVLWANTTCPDRTNSDSNGGTCVGHLVPLPLP